MSSKNTLNCGGQIVDLNHPVVMGILNVTPDSFSDGGEFLAPEQAIQHAREMTQEGAAIIDIGGESTRPGAKAVSVDEELARVIPLIETLRGETDIPISVDTSKPEVMTAAVEAGAGMINDVRALQEPGALKAAATADVPVCLMHMLGQPRTMQKNPQYDDVTEDVYQFLQDRAQAALDAGIQSDKLLFDPGFGFGKTVEHNFILLRELKKFTESGYPVLVGMSRKSMIGAILNNQVHERLPASLALAILAAERGADIIRVHDVRETVEALKMRQAMFNQEK